MILLDTNILAEPTKPKPDQNFLRWYNQQSLQRLFISTISLAEMELGIALLPAGQRRQRFIEITEEVIENFDGQILVFGQRAAELYGELVAKRRKMGHQIQVQDAQIAAIAIANGLQLATRNVKDFANIDGLSLINPWQFAG